MNKWFALLFSTFLAASGLIALMPAAAFTFDLKVWEGSINPETKERFIPVELWIGAEWDGKPVVTLSKADLEFGSANEKNITGPFEWTRPKTGETLLVYERKNGSKRQLFTVTNNGSGLGRVYDSRYDRDCINEV